jgi:hypothetical protein
MSSSCTLRLSCCFVQNFGFIAYVFVGIMLLRAHLHLRGPCRIPCSPSTPAIV